MGIIKAAVAEIKKAEVSYAEQGSGGLRFLSALLCKPIPTQIGGRVIGAEAAVRADQKADILSARGELCRRGARSDLDVVRMRAEEEKALTALQLRQGSGKAQNRSCQAHALRAASSAQMRSYSSSSS